MGLPVYLPPPLDCVLHKDMKLSPQAESKYSAIAEDLFESFCLYQVNFLADIPASSSYYSTCNLQSELNEY